MVGVISSCHEPRNRQKVNQTNLGRFALINFSHGTGHWIESRHLHSHLTNWLMSFYIERAKLVKAGLYERKKKLWLPFVHEIKVDEIAESYPMATLVDHLDDRALLA